MPTLEELLSDCGLGEQPAQTKVAAAAPSTSEIDKVLEDLGLSDAETVKTASEEIPADNGGQMDMKGIYERLIGEEAAPEAAAETNEKTASEQPAATETDEAPASREEVLGEITSEFFNAAVEGYVEKVAASLEAEAGPGHKPSHMGGAPSAVGKSLGLNGANAAIGQNHATGDHGKAEVMTHGNSPYGIKEKALLKHLAKRMHGKNPNLGVVTE